MCCVSLYKRAAHFTTKILFVDYKTKCTKSISHHACIYDYRCRSFCAMKLCCLYAATFLSSSEFNSILYAPKCFIIRLFIQDFLRLCLSHGPRCTEQFYFIAFAIVSSSSSSSFQLLLVSLVYIFRAILCLAILFYTHLYTFLFMYNTNLRSQSFSFVHCAPPALPQPATIIIILMLYRCLSIHGCVRLLLIRCSMLSLISLLSKFRSLIKYRSKIEWRVSEYVCQWIDVRVCCCQYD